MVGMRKKARDKRGRFASNGDDTETTEAPAEATEPGPSPVSDGLTITAAHKLNPQRGNGNWAVFEASTDDGVVITVMAKNEHAIAGRWSGEVTVDFD